MVLHVSLHFTLHAGSANKERLHRSGLRNTRTNGSRKCMLFFLDACAYFDIATLQNDMVEFNQCQATLKTLYELGIPGKQEEFTAYRILMLLHGRNRSGPSCFLWTVNDL